MDQTGWYPDPGEEILSNIDRGEEEQKSPGRTSHFFFKGK
jgi:hypothetical protein